MAGLRFLIAAVALALIVGAPVQWMANDAVSPGSNAVCGVTDLMALDGKSQFRGPPPPPPAKPPDGEGPQLTADDFTRIMRDRHGRTLPAALLRRAEAADVEVRVSVGAAYSPEPTSYDFIATRSAREWRIAKKVKRLRVYSDEPPPPAIYRDLILATDDAAELDRLLREPCLWSAPPMIPEFIKLRDGGWSECHHGSVTTIDIRVGDRRWSGTQICRLFGVPGELAVAVRAASGEEWEATDTRLIRWLGPPPEPD